MNPGYHKHGGADDTFYRADVCPICKEGGGGQTRSLSVQIAVDALEAILNVEGAARLGVDRGRLERCLREVFEAMDGNEWNADTLQRIANRLEADLGFEFLEYDDLEDD